MTTSEYFKSLLDNINLKMKDEERQLIEDKQNSLRESLNEILPLEDDFLTGSYARHTIIKPKGANDKFDVDVFVAFSNDDYGEAELAELHKLVVSALEDIKVNKPKLGITKINTSQRRSVGVEFGNNFQVDIVPAIEIEKGNLYKIFDKRTLKPLRSNPKIHGELLSKANERTGQMLVSIIKILKSWRRNKCDYVKSFHLELLATEVIGSKKIESYTQRLVDFFVNGHPKLKTACLKDPANPKGDSYVDAYLDDDGTRQKLLNLVSVEAQIAKLAMELEKEGRLDEAVEEWEKIFSDDFSNNENASDNNVNLPPRPAPGPHTPPMPPRRREVG